MTADEFRSYLTAQPFRPFRIFMSDGVAFDVSPAELAILGLTTVRLVLYEPTPNNLKAERKILLSLLHLRASNTSLLNSNPPSSLSPLPRSSSVRLVLFASRLAEE